MKYVYVYLYPAISKFLKSKWGKWGVDICDLIFIAGGGGGALLW